MNTYFKKDFMKKILVLNDQIFLNRSIAEKYKTLFESINITLDICMDDEHGDLAKLLVKEDVDFNNYIDFFTRNDIRYTATIYI